MKAILLSAVLLVGIIGENVHAQSIAPKREFRGAWIATVINLDWPSTRFLGENAQQSELLRILDELQDAGINAVFSKYAAKLTRSISQISSLGRIG